MGENFDTIKIRKLLGLSEHEEKRAIELSDSLLPRQEYLDGELKLQYDYEFPGGEVFSATENEDGIASLTIERDGQVVVDFSDFLAEGHKFVTPSYSLRLRSGIGLNEHIWSYSLEHKEVLIGDVRDPLDIISVLHETAHTHQKLISKYIDLVKATRRSKSHKQTEGKKAIEQHKDLDVITSRMERDAWAEALRKIRQIHDDHNLDLLESAGGFGDLKKHIYFCLFLQRCTAINRIVMRAFDQFSPSEIESWWFPTEEDLEYLKDLFDKEKLKRE